MKGFKQTELYAESVEINGSTEKPKLASVWITFPKISVGGPVVFPTLLAASSLLLQSPFTDLQGRISGKQDPSPKPLQ